MIKKYIACLSILGAFQVQAQLVTKVLTCGPVYSGFPFTIEFKGESAILNFKDETYALRFIRAWQTTQGEKWVDYGNPELVVSSSWPVEPYVAISLVNRKNSMAACDVTELP